MITITSFKKYIPPIISYYLNKIKCFNITFKGPYGSWRQAVAHSTGYGTEEIINKVKYAALEVKEGRAAFERDSVLFYKKRYPYFILTGLLYTYLKSRDAIKVLDVGGSLGSIYYQCFPFIKELPLSRWNIVEQQKIADIGKQMFENNRIRFYSDLEKCINEQDDINVVLLSSSLQYLEKPYRVVKKITEINTKVVIVDRTPVHDGHKDIIVVQHTPAKIYKASYPCWIFSQSKLFNELKKYFVQRDVFFSNELVNMKKYQARYHSAIWER